MSASIDCQEAAYATERPLLEIKDLDVGFTTGNGEVNGRPRREPRPSMPGRPWRSWASPVPGKSTTALRDHRPAPGQRPASPAGRSCSRARTSPSAAEKRRSRTARRQPSAWSRRTRCPTSTRCGRSAYQVREALRANGLPSGADAKRQVAQVLTEAGLGDAEPPAQAVPARVLRRHAPARADRDRAGLPAASCSSPTSPPRRSTSPCSARSSTTWRS